MLSAKVWREDTDVKMKIFHVQPSALHLQRTIEAAAKQVKKTDKTRRNAPYLLTAVGVLLAIALIVMTKLHVGAH